MTEKIGNVVLDYEFYPGEDFYCDGAVEDEMLEIVKNHPASDFPGIIRERSSWPILYHLSDLRENIVEWLPMDKSMKVLEVGSGCGAITGSLARKAGNVTCLDLSRKRSLINAYRHQDCDNVTIKLGNFQDIEPSLDTDYDYVVLIGVFEYGQSYIRSENPFVDWYNILKKHVKKDGRIVIAIENKMGLKYWAGCREDHLSTYFSGIEDYPDGGVVRTFTKGGLERILKECGEEQYHFYYPYPDYKFMTTVYSDRYLPKVGELSNNLRNFDQERLQLFDEKNVFDMLIREGMFPLYSNSYMVVTGPQPDVVYSRFSNDRAPEYAIRTEIAEQKDGGKVVRKYPFGEKAQAHIDNIRTSFEKLSARYAGSRLSVNVCEQKEEGGERFAELEFLENGVTLEELLDECLKNRDAEGFHRLFNAYKEAVSHQNPDADVITDFDLIFSNIMVQNDKWSIIDYEWVLPEAIPADQLALRALHCYFLENEKRGQILKSMSQKAGTAENDAAENGWTEVLNRLGMTEEDAESLAEKEKQFQHRVTGERTSISDMRHLIGNRVIPLQWITAMADRKMVEIFEDFGEGYKPENSYYRYDAYQTEDVIKMTIPVKKNVSAIRLDPAERPCIVCLKKLTCNREPLSLEKAVTTNGTKLDKNAETSVFFATNDPNINISLESIPVSEREGAMLEVEAEIVLLPESMTEDLKKKLKVNRRSGIGFRH